MTNNSKYVIIGGILGSIISVVVFALGLVVLVSTPSLLHHAPSSILFGTVLVLNILFNFFAGSLIFTGFMNNNLSIVMVVVAGLAQGFFVGSVVGWIFYKIRSRNKVIEY